jgi:hypothetical protein
MEAILKFYLPDENYEFEVAVKAQALHSILWEYNKFIRGDLKHNDKLTAKQTELAKIYQSKFLELLRDNNVSLDQV